MDTDLKLFKGVIIIVQVLCAAAFKISVESDEESLVSRYEKYFQADRQLDEDYAKFEMEIAENGQLPSCWQNSENAMGKYWSNTDSRK